MGTCRTGGLGIGAAALTLLLPFSVQAQELDLGDVRDCRCSLNLTEIVRIGEMEGDGIVEGEMPIVVFDETGDEIALFAHGGFRVKRFDDSGEFLGAFGRHGQGPGDLGWITSATYLEDRLILQDYDRGGFVTVDEEGNELSYFRTPLNSGEFMRLDEEHVVVARLDRTIERAGLPLHRVSLRDSTIESFGSDGSYSILRPFGGAVLLGRSSDREHVWWGTTDRLHFEQWDVETAEPVRFVTGYPSWWDPEGTNTAPGEAPLSVFQFGVDSQDVLWTAVRVPDPDWDPRVVARRTEQMFVREEYDDVWDTRLDAIDLSTGRHLGSVRLPEASIFMADRNGELVISRLEYTNDFFPQIAIYRPTPSGR